MLSLDLGSVINLRPRFRLMPKLRLRLRLKLRLVLTLGLRHGLRLGLGFGLGIMLRNKVMHMFSLMCIVA